MRRLLPLLLVLGCAYEAPLDDRATTSPAIVRGTVVLAGPTEPADTLVLVYPGDNPPPPFGTGRPITFSTVPATDFRGNTGGVFEADYDVSVPIEGDAEVLVTALVDVDGDFYPLPPLGTVMGGATCGDWSGAHLSDLQSGTFATVSISRNTSTDGVSVVVGRELGLERPAFVMQGGTPVLSRAMAATGALQTFRLASTGIDAVLPGEDGAVLPLLQIGGPFDGSDPCGTALWTTILDEDGDGQPDPSPDFPPETGLIAAWPQVVLQYLGEVDADGVVTPSLEPGESWAMRTALFPDVAWFGVTPLNVPTPLTELELIFVPAAAHTLPDGTTEVVQDPTQLPAGAWSITVINQAGQTWTLPNALAGVGSADPERFVPASQAGALILE